LRNKPPQILHPLEWYNRNIAGPITNYSIFYYNPKHDDNEMLLIKEHFKCLVFTTTEKLQIIKHEKNSITYLYSTVVWFLGCNTTLLVSISSL
jgi:hypothetical protein